MLKTFKCKVHFLTKYVIQSGITVLFLLFLFGALYLRVHVFKRNHPTVFYLDVEGKKNLEVLHVLSCLTLFLRQYLFQKYVSSVWISISAASQISQRLLCNTF